MRSFHKLVPGDLTLHREVIDTIAAAGAKGQPAAERVGEVWGLLRAGASGLLRDGSGELEPVRRHPEKGLWELKWSFPRLGEFRMYHVEPRTNPDLVALHFHRKDTTGTQDEIDGRQDAEMDVAAQRYDDGVNARWGHARKFCSACVAEIESSL
jgi:hypothetical protein